MHEEKITETDIQSGIDDKLGKGLLSILNHISLEHTPFFYTDCFKMLTRNIDKLFRVIEYVLRKECIFMTSNFYISNGYVSKRKDSPRARSVLESFIEGYSGTIVCDGYSAYDKLEGVTFAN